MVGERNCDGFLPFARNDGAFEFEGVRWARRYGTGARAAKTSAGNDIGAVFVVVVISLNI